MALCNASMLAPDGRCKSFDSRANGYARADGVGVVVLKTLEQAQADGDAIYAVIHGSAVNQDGHSSGLTVPNGDAQMIVMRDALRAAALERCRSELCRGARHRHAGGRPDRGQRPRHSPECRPAGSDALSDRLSQIQFRPFGIGGGRRRPDQGRVDAASRPHPCQSQSRNAEPQNSL